MERILLDRMSQNVAEHCLIQPQLRTCALGKFFTALCMNTNDHEYPMNTDLGMTSFFNYGSHGKWGSIVPPCKILENYQITLVNILFVNTMNYFTHTFIIILILLLDHLLLLPSGLALPFLNCGHSHFCFLALNFFVYVENT